MPCYDIDLPSGAHAHVHVEADAEAEWGLESMQAVFAVIEAADKYLREGGDPDDAG